MIFSGEPCVTKFHLVIPKGHHFKLNERIAETKGLLHQIESRSYPSIISPIEHKDLGITTQREKDPYPISGLHSEESVGTAFLIEQLRIAG